jgi:CRISPR/Cas system CMR subunit Cmr6 (Cas7 group RAMP superfamily)
MIGNWLCFELESDAVFGRGSSIPGLIDQEIALDPSGCPYLHGRTLKGLFSIAQCEKEIRTRFTQQALEGATMQIRATRRV